MRVKQNQIPDSFRLEKMILLYKNKGSVDGINQYHGIFIRVAILIIYQKWLYSKAAPILDKVGSSYAFGGRKRKVWE